MSKRFRSKLLAILLAVTVATTFIPTVPVAYANAEGTPGDGTTVSQEQEMEKEEKEKPEPEVKEEPAPAPVQEEPAAEPQQEVQQPAEDESSKA